MQAFHQSDLQSDLPGQRKAVSAVTRDTPRDARLVEVHQTNAAAEHLVAEDAVDRAAAGREVRARIGEHGLDEELL